MDKSFNVKKNEIGAANIYLLPIMIYVILDALVLYAVIVSHSEYQINILFLSLFIGALWLFAFLKSGHIKSMRKQVYIILLCIPFSMFLACTIWGNHYLNLFPIDAFNCGNISMDTLFHSAIVQSFLRNEGPSALINDENIIRYHTFSHFIFSLISKATRIPPYFVYNYVYPILFLPLYVWSQLFAIENAKRLFSNKKDIQIIDIIVLLLFNVGYMPINIQNRTRQTGAFSWYVSESFLVANTFLFITIAICFIYIYATKKDSDMFTQSKLQIIKFGIIPLMIYVVTASKVSVGFFLVIAILYYLVRSHISWYMILYYGAVFFYSGWMHVDIIKSSGGGYSLKAIFHLLFSPSWIIGFFLFTIWEWIYISFDIKKNRYSINDFRKGKTIWIELTLITILAVHLMGIIIWTSSSSGRYFTLLTEIPGVLMLCSMDFDLLKLQNRNKYILMYGICFTWIIFLCIYNKPPVTNLTDQRGNNTHSNYSFFMDIKDVVGEDPDKYAIYINNDSTAIKGMEFETLSNIFSFPALTSVGVINASYYDDKKGEYCLYTDENAYGFDTLSVNHRKLSLSEALKRAGDNGKSYLINISGNSYEILNCGFRSSCLQKTPVRTGFTRPYRGFCVYGVTLPEKNHMFVV